MKTHDLLPDQPFRLTTSESDPGKFVALFCDCWTRIPESDRCVISDFWNELNHGPLIELSDCWGDSNESFAQVTRGGAIVRFGAKDFAVLPPCVSTWIIAHELAHVYQKAVGQKPGGESEKTNEAEADSIAKSWGFDDMPRIILDLLMRGPKQLSFEAACKELPNIAKRT